MRRPILLIGNLNAPNNMSVVNVSEAVKMFLLFTKTYAIKVAPVASTGETTEKIQVHPQMNSSRL